MLTVDVYKSLPGTTIDVTFEYGRGIFVLFGPSGSGKSTAPSFRRGETAGSAGPRPDGGARPSPSGRTPLGPGSRQPEEPAARAVAAPAILADSLRSRDPQPEGEAEACRLDPRSRSRKKKSLRVSVDARCGARACIVRIPSFGRSPPLFSNSHKAHCFSLLITRSLSCRFGIDTY